MRWFLYDSLRLALTASGLALWVVLLGLLFGAI